MNETVILLHEHELVRWGPKQCGDKLRAYCPLHGGDHQRSNEHKELLEAHARQMGGSEQRSIRRWRKTNPAGYFGVAPSSLADCLIIVEGAFDRLALLAAGMDPPDVLALIGTALQVETLPLSVQSVVLALDGDEAGQKAAQKMAADVQAAGLAATLCPVPADGQGKDWSERWRRTPVYGDDAIYCVFEA